MAARRSTRSAVERYRLGGVRLPAVQRRRFRRLDRRSAQRGIADPRSLPRRSHAAGPRTQAHAGIFPRRLFARRHRSTIPAIELGLADAARQGRHPDERYASEPSRRRSSCAFCSTKRGSGGTRRSTSPSARSPTPTIRCLPEALERWPVEWMQFPHSAPSRDHLRDQPPAHGRHSRPLSRRRGAGGPGQPDRGGAGEARPDGQSRDCRLAQHQRRGGDPFEAAARDDGARSRGGLSRAFQQQDERGDAEALAPARQSASRRDDFRGDRRRLDHGPRRIEGAAAAGGRCSVSREDSRRPSARPRRGSSTGSSGTRRSSSIRTRSSIARSSAFTNTSASCSTP